MSRSRFLLIAPLFFVVLPAVADEAVKKEKVTPLPQAHAHNDYYHKRPLLDALSHGFTSVEADIFLVNGKLLVGHSRRELREDKTLQKLYLDPLRERVRKNGGGVYAGGGKFKAAGFTLMIDIKSEGKSTYAALSKVLAEYPEMLTTVRDGKAKKKAITIVISGNRAREWIAADKVRYAGIDGRLGDLDSNLPAHLLPMISDHWGRNFRWRGKGEFSEAEREKLRAIVKRAHAKGRRVRFWATPESTAVWKELQAAGVDHINTDDLPGLSRFLREQGAK